MQANFSVQPHDGNRSLETALNDKRIPGLDFLRAVAVLLVLLDHSGLGKVGPIAMFSGGIGVEIFFVLSGFLITWLLLEEWDKKDPVRKTAEILAKKGVSKNEIEKIESESKNEIEEAVAYANGLPTPDSKEAFKNVFIS